MEEEKIDIAQAILLIKDLLRDHLITYLKHVGIRELYTDDLRKLISLMIDWYDGKMNEYEFVTSIQNILLNYQTREKPSKIAIGLVEHLKNVIRKACEEFGIDTGEEPFFRNF